MNELRCPQCGAPVDAGAAECKYCGERLSFQQSAVQPDAGAQQGGYQSGPAYGDGYQQGPGYGNFQGGPQPNPYQGQPQPQVYQVPPQPQGYQQPMPGYYNNPAIDPSWPVKSKLCAGLLGIFLGTFGIHKFYMGKVGMGILYICFCWTYIPAIVGFIEGIMYLCSSDENFILKHHVRVR